jgi:hypothetical protein
VKSGGISVSHSQATALTVPALSSMIYSTVMIIVVLFIKIRKISTILYSLPPPHQSRFRVGDVIDALGRGRRRGRGKPAYDPYLFWGGGVTIERRKKYTKIKIIRKFIF